MAGVCSIDYNIAGAHKALAAGNSGQIENRGLARQRGQRLCPARDTQDGVSGIMKPAREQPSKPSGGAENYDAGVVFFGHGFRYNMLRNEPYSNMPPSPSRSGVWRFSPAGTAMPRLPFVIS